MIATVHIAPIERWCDPVRANGDQRVVGLPVDIYPQTCQKAYFTTCDGREWKLTDESAERIRGILGKDFHPFVQFWMCEHQLAMD